MSELIINRDEKQKKLKELIKRLHDGVKPEDVQEEFDKLIVGVTPAEIAKMEQALVMEGMPVTDIQRLCDVHAAVFKGSIEDIHKDDVTKVDVPVSNEGHPIDTLKKENKEIEILLNNIIIKDLSDYSDKQTSTSKKRLLESIKKLKTIDKHYSRKENIIFPIMEKYNITAPPQVMWGIHDEIRDEIKGVISLLNEEKSVLPTLNESVSALVNKTNEMIFKEESIMFPMIEDTFTQQEWIDIEKASEEIGFTIINNVTRWMPAVIANVIEPKQNETTSNYQKDSGDIKFDGGSLSAEEINSIFNTVPLDMTFVDANNHVKYFTQGKERVFERPLTIIGREVKYCHPPKSVHIVEKIVDDFRTGKKDNEDFWIKMGNMFVYIRYFAVRNSEGKFLGTLEVTQNIKPITELEGEKRLMS
ncbi:MAG: DUF438 domain-containing protein [Clostridiales bacterium]|nr:DUF438 domain-containing protein [Clostridiales bacterium]